MKQRHVNQVLFTAAALAMAGLIPAAKGQIVVDGSLDAGYGSPLAVQTINTGFGDSTIGDGTSSGGSELDAAYANISNGTLYLFFSGNFENNGNHVDVFIDDGRSGGQNVLALNAPNNESSPLNGANGLTLPTGFNATYVVDGNDYANTFYIDQYDLTHSTVGNYLGSIPLTGGIGNNQNLNGIAVGVNNTNAAGVNGSTGTAADPVAAAAVTTGLELGIPLGALGNPTGSIQVLAAINGGGDGYLSNQFLPGLPVGTGNLGGPGSVNLSASGFNASTFSVTIPANSSGASWVSTDGGSWNGSGNWTTGMVPNASGASATFVVGTNGSNINVTVDAPITVGSITFNSLASYNISSGTGGSLTLGGPSGASITNYYGSQLISAPMVLNSTTTVTASSHGDNITLSGNINGSGGLVVFDQGGSGSGFPGSVILLSGSNTYTGGTTINGGNLQLGSPNALPALSAITFSALDLPPGVLDLNGFSASASSLTVLTGPLTGPTGAFAQIINTSATPGTATFTYSGNSSNPSIFSGNISDNSNSGGGTTALLVTSGSLTLSGTDTYAGSTNVSGGKLFLASAGALPSSTNLIIGSGASVVASNLSLNSTPGTKYAVTVGSLSVVGQLDLTNNGLVIHNSSIGAVTAMVASGYNNGNWNGTSGIVSSTAAADSTHLTALGTILNSSDGNTLYGLGSQFGDFDGDGNLQPTDVLVKYTYYGDANLDGTVDASDYSLIDNGYLNGLTGWYNGDFNYDGVVNGSDYTLIDNAFNMQGASLAAADATPDALATTQLAGASSVPEPATISLLAIGALGLPGRRRKA